MRPSEVERFKRIVQGTKISRRNTLEENVGGYSVRVVYVFLSTKGALGAVSFSAVDFDALKSMVSCRLQVTVKKLL
jgi:hypothetical protein